MYVVWVFAKTTAVGSRSWVEDKHIKPIKRTFEDKALYDTYLMALKDVEGGVVQVINYIDHGETTDRRPGNGQTS